MPKRSNTFKAISEKYSKGRENAFHLKESSDDGSLTARSDSGMKNLNYKSLGDINGNTMAQSMKDGESKEHSFNLKNVSQQRTGITKIRNKMNFCLNDEKQKILEIK